MVQLRKGILFFLLAFTVFFWGCHKSGNNPGITPVDTTTPFIYGVMRAQIDLSNDTTEPYAEAYFFNDSINKQNIYVGTVSLNSDTLYYTSEYLGSPLPKFEDSVHWKISASPYNPEIIYNVDNNFPTYREKIPDTVVALNGISFNFTTANTNNADSGYIYIEEARITKFCSGTGGIVTFSASELYTALISQGSTPPTTLTFDVAAYNSAIKIYGGKSYKFVNMASIRKVIYFY